MVKQTLGKPAVVCYGEILWDILPSGSKPGGAPMNVAYHLSRMGIETNLISRVGRDHKGEELIDLLKSWHLSTAFCQVDSNLATSEVHALIGENHEVNYEILYPVAWDRISFQDEFYELLNNSDAFVFGSLSSRDKVSEKTLFQLLEMSKFNVLDVNLRPPHFSPQIISGLLTKTDLLKLNSAELTLITGWFNESCNTEKEQVDFLFGEYKIKEVIVTKGSNGASYYTPEKFDDHPAYKVAVADTVGAGDAFLAAFLSKKLVNAHPYEMMSYAMALGAYVAMSAGACPQYSIKDLESFYRQQAHNI